MDAASHIPDDANLAELAAAARSIVPPAPHEWGSVLRSEAADPLVALLTRVARGRAALDIAIGEGLLGLREGNRTMRFGYAGIGDYARERLGIAAGTALKLARRAERLRSVPLLRNAVWLGVISLSKTDAILPVARGEDEASWVERARRDTVRALEKAVRASGAVVPEEEEKWERVFVQLFPDAKPTWDKALELAGREVGLAAPKWQRVNAICEEYLGAHAPPDEDGDEVMRSPVGNWLEELKEDLEKVSQQWAFLDRETAVVAPVPIVPQMEDAVLLDEELRRLAATRTEWDEVFGHLAMVFKMTGLWREAQFASFDHFCEEQLGMGGRTVEQRIALERRLYALPKLRQALRDGRVSYEKARAIAWTADDTTEEQWIARAQTMTCIALRREIEEHEEGQISTRGGFDLRMPARVRRVLEDAIRAARKEAGKWITPSECLRRIAQHFIDVWEKGRKERNTVQNRVRKRDKGFCQVPWCSRVMAHVHHIIRRSQGGSNDPSNLISLCVAHHLHGVHDGWIRVSGKAPDKLRWTVVADHSAAPPWVAAACDGRVSAAA
ncbi:MAG TPA: HNH endonuclease [Myxococcales bacterium]|nr:HNH endonuclease [Myxococcales bacterium]